ncbi:MAG: efflux RND transporter periplasmic adaptor subunit [Sulfurovum sp.]|nr:MAG: efflux RND transporter periplasmic adaptor subunit [Sulfurovum sp.]
MKKIIITIVVIVAVAALMIKGKGLLESRKAEIANEALPTVASVTVSVVNPTQGMMNNRESYLAQVGSDKSIKLSTKLAGYVERVFVEESQKVKQGDLLVHIDETELQSNIQAVQATLIAQRNDRALAKSIYMRNVKLFKVGGLAKEKLDISKVAMKAKEAVVENTMQKIEQLGHQLSYLKIVAPFDGEIDAILLHEGDLAASGKPILSMSNGVKKLLFSYAPHHTSVQKDQLVLAAGQKVGRIKSIYTTSQNGLMTAEVKLTSTLDLPVGSSMNIEVLTKEAKGCIVPSDTVLHKKEGTFVMTYAKGKFTPLQVSVKMQEADHLLISPCPTTAVAKASEVKLAQLPAYDKVEIIGAKDE